MIIHLKFYNLLSIRKIALNETHQFVDKILISDITCITYKNVTQSSYPDGISVSEQEYAARAIDGDQFVFTQTKHENQSYWTITFQRPTIISCFSMFIYGGRVSDWVFVNFISCII